jgi:hypothetical protein
MTHQEIKRVKEVSKPPNQLQEELAVTQDAS